MSPPPTDRYGGVVYIRIVYTQRGSVEVWQATAPFRYSLLLSCTVLPFVWWSATCAWIVSLIVDSVCVLCSG